MSSSLRVLLVDDHHDGADSLADLIRLYGHIATVAYDPDIALTAVVTFQPDVFITDIGMPRVDGCALAEKVKNLSPRKPLLIAMTGYGHPAALDRCREVGFDHVFLKAADPEGLEAVLRQHAERLEQDAAEGSAPR